MKKAFLFLTVLCLLSCSSFALALDDKYFGEWKFYYSNTHYHDSKLDDNVTTVAEAYRYGNDANTITINKDDTLEFVEYGKKPFTTMWLDSEMYVDSEYGDIPNLWVCMPDGSEGVFAIVDGMLRYGVSFGDVYTTTYIYYKPELYQLNADHVQNKALKLTSVYSDTPEEPFLHPKKFPNEEGLDCLIMLNEDNSADVLLNYVPYEAVWHIENLSICLELENGGSMRLECQLDETFFGTLKPMPNAEEYHVKFEQTEPFRFEQPLSLEQFKGTWELSGIHDRFFTYGKDQINFNMTLNIGDDYATLDCVFDDTQEMRKWEYGLDIAGVPVLNEEYVGTALLFIKSDSSAMGVWLLKDGSLYLRIPGSNCYYFTRK